MALPELVLEYVKVLAWPAVVVTAVVVFRSPLSELIDRIRSVSAFGASAQLAEREKADVEATLAETAVALGIEGDTKDSKADDGAKSGKEQAADAPSGNGHAPEARRSEAETGLRRAAVEALVREAAEWGQARGAAGLDVAGTRIIWKGTEPRLHVPDTSNSSSETPKSSKRRINQQRALKMLANSAASDPYVQNLEARAQELTERLSHAIVAGGDFMSRMALEEELRGVQKKLAVVHPTSGYL